MLHLWCTAVKHPHGPPRALSHFSDVTIASSQFHIFADTSSDNPQRDVNPPWCELVPVGEGNCPCTSELLLLTWPGCAREVAAIIQILKRCFCSRSRQRTLFAKKSTHPTVSRLEWMSFLPFIFCLKIPFQLRSKKSWSTFHRERPSFGTGRCEAIRDTKVVSHSQKTL